MGQLLLMAGRWLIGRFGKWMAGLITMIGLLLTSYWSGRRSRQRQLEADNARQMKKQFEITTTIPKSQEELLERLREKGL